MHVKPRSLAAAIVSKAVAVLLAIGLIFAVSERKAHPISSYSWQTGLACSACQYTPPELNLFGRKFKLEGYTFVTKPEVNDVSKKSEDWGVSCS